MKVKVTICKEVEIEVSDKFEKLNVDINDDFCFSLEAFELREELAKEVQSITGYEPMAGTMEEVRASTTNEYIAFVEKIGGYTLLEY